MGKRYPNHPFYLEDYVAPNDLLLQVGVARNYGYWTCTKCFAEGHTNHSYDVDVAEEDARVHAREHSHHCPQWPEGRSSPPAENG